MQYNAFTEMVTVLKQSLENIAQPGYKICIDYLIKFMETKNIAYADALIAHLSAKENQLVLQTRAHTLYRCLAVFKNVNQNNLDDPTIRVRTDQLITILNISDVASINNSSNHGLDDTREFIHSQKKRKKNTG